MYVNELLERDAVNGGASVNSKRQALQAVADLAARTLDLDPVMVLNALMEREKLGSTGVGVGVAVPHAALPGLDRMHGIFVRLETPVDFEAIDEVPVDLIFALLAPENAMTEHLRALAKVSRLLRQKTLRDELRAIDNDDALYALLTNMSDYKVA